MSGGPETSEATSTRPGSALTRAERFVLTTVVLGTMLAPLNSTMIAVALPRVMDDFDAGVRSAGWLVTAYLIVMASLQPVAGKIGDRLGRRRLVLAGLSLFGLASLSAALAPNLWVLILFRVLQAAAGALIVPNGVALVREVVQEGHRGRAFGLVGGGTALAAALGPPIGGVLVEIEGWRAIFFVNLVLVLPALVVGWRWLPTTDTSDTSSVRSQFDLMGAIMLSVLLVGAVGLLTSVTRGGNAWVFAVGAGTLAVIATAFARQEFRHPDPVVQPRLFRRRPFAAACSAIGLSNLAMYTLLLSVPLLLVRRNGSDLQTGLVLTALSAAMIVMAPVGGRLADRLGRRVPTMAGLALLAVGVAPIAMMGADITLAALVGSLAVAGIGLGLSMPGLQTSAVESVGSREAGMASGVYSTSRYLGSILGSAILAGLLGADRSDVDGLSAAFVMVLAAAILALISGLGLRARPGALRPA